jgi:hypothetical protein
MLFKKRASLAEVGETWNPFKHCNGHVIAMDSEATGVYTYSAESRPIIS